jgi:hypothetical protein
MRKKIIEKTLATPYHFFLLSSDEISQNRCKFLHSSNDNNVLSPSLSLYKLTIELFFLDIAD